MARITLIGVTVIIVASEIVIPPEFVKPSTSGLRPREGYRR